MLLAQAETEIDTLNRQNADSAKQAVRVRHLAIVPPSGWTTINFSELFQYRDLLWFLTLRDIKARYKQSALGPLWIMLLPLASSGIFSLVFGVLGGFPSGDLPYPIYVFSGMVIWNLFTKAFTASAESLHAYQNIITKIYFPRLVVPVSASFSGLVDFALGCALLVVFMLMAGIVPGWTVLLAPAFVMLALLAGIAGGLWVAALSVRFRDLRHVAQIVPRLWMWLTPVAYSTQVVLNNENIPERWQPVLETLFQLNPLFLVIEGFRWSALGDADSAPSATALVGLAIIIAALFAGLMIFRRTEATVADVI